MNDKLKMIFLDNPDITEQIEEFCAQDPAFLKTEQEFYGTAHKIAEVAGFELYSRFERCFRNYLACSNDLYYLFGLGLRQEIISALQPKVS